MVAFIVAAWKRFQLWLYAWFYVSSIAALSASRRARMSHNNGILGRGTIRIVDNPEFPECDFFEPGREFSCRLRHATVSFVDDAMMTVRGASLKFADSEFKSPLDLEMNTGKVTFFWSCRNFIHFAFDRRMKGAPSGVGFRKYYERYPRGMIGAQVGFKRNPTSFAQMYYYSQTPMEFHAKDGKPRYVKFRLIPDDRGEDSGIIDASVYNSPDTLMDQRIFEGETRGRNYLKDEWRERVQGGGAKYHLQMQLHEASPDDTDEIFNSNEEWDPETHPFMDVATVTINEVLPFRDQVYTRYFIGHLPKSVSIFKAKDVDDYNSLNYMRIRSGLPRRVRVLSTKIFGLPKEYADDGPRNIKLPGS